MSEEWAEEEIQITKKQQCSPLLVIKTTNLNNFSLLK